MKLRRGRSNPSRSRQRMTDLNDEASNPRASYRSARSNEQPNIGRSISRKKDSQSNTFSGSLWFQRIGLIILLLAILASAINLLKLSNNAEILPLTNNGSNTLVFDETAYQSAADHLLAESVWNHNKITVDTGHISRQLLAQFPDISNVSITIPLFSHRPIIYIEPAQPALIIQSASSGSFVINESGKAVLTTSHNPIAPGQPKLPVVTDLSGLKLVLGYQVLPANTVSFVQVVAAQLSAKQYTVTSMTLPPATSELDVALKGKPYIIKFNLENDDPRQQVGTFLAAIANLQSQSITPSQYVDVRVDGRAYYK